MTHDQFLQFDFLREDFRYLQPALIKVFKPHEEKLHNIPEQHLGTAINMLESFLEDTHIAYAPVKIRNELPKVIHQLTAKQALYIILILVLIMKNCTDSYWKSLILNISSLFIGNGMAAYIEHTFHQFNPEIHSTDSWSWPDWTAYTMLFLMTGILAILPKEYGYFYHKMEGTVFELQKKQVLFGDFKKHGLEFNDVYILELAYLNYLSFLYGNLERHIKKLRIAPYWQILSGFSHKFLYDSQYIHGPTSDPSATLPPTLRRQIGYGVASIPQAAMATTPLNWNVSKALHTNFFYSELLKAMVRTKDLYSEQDHDLAKLASNSVKTLRDPGLTKLLQIMLNHITQEQIKEFLKIRKEEVKKEVNKSHDALTQRTLVLIEKLLNITMLSANPGEMPSPIAQRPPAPPAVEPLPPASPAESAATPPIDFDLASSVATSTIPSGRASPVPKLLPRRRITLTQLNFNSPENSSFQLERMTLEHLNQKYGPLNSEPKPHEAMSARTRIIGHSWQSLLVEYQAILANMPDSLYKNYLDLIIDVHAKVFLPHKSLLALSVDVDTVSEDTVSVSVLPKLPQPETNDLALIPAIRERLTTVLEHHYRFVQVKLAELEYYPNSQAGLYLGQYLPCLPLNNTQKEGFISALANAVYAEIGIELYLTGSAVLLEPYSNDIDLVGLFYNAAQITSLEKLLQTKHIICKERRDTAIYIQYSLSCDNIEIDLTLNRVTKKDAEQSGTWLLENSYKRFINYFSVFRNVRTYQLLVHPIILSGIIKKTLDFNLSLAPAELPPTDFLHMVVPPNPDANEIFRAHEFIVRKLFAYRINYRGINTAITLGQNLRRYETLLWDPNFIELSLVHFFLYLNHPKNREHALAVFQYYIPNLNKLLALRDGQLAIPSNMQNNLRQYQGPYLGLILLMYYYLENLHFDVQRLPSAKLGFRIKIYPTGTAPFNFTDADFKHAHQAILAATPVPSSSSYANFVRDYRTVTETRGPRRLSPTAVEFYPQRPSNGYQT